MKTMRMNLAALVLASAFACFTFFQPVVTTAMNKRTLGSGSPCPALRIVVSSKDQKELNQSVNRRHAAGECSAARADGSGQSQGQAGSPSGESAHSD
jgi:hypothetical protein